MKRQADDHAAGAERDGVKQSRRIEAQFPRRRVDIWRIVRLGGDHQRQVVEAVQQRRDDPRRPYAQRRAEPGPRIFGASEGEAAEQAKEDMQRDGGGDARRGDQPPSLAGGGEVENVLEQREPERRRGCAEHEAARVAAQPMRADEEVEAGELCRFLRETCKSEGLNDDRNVKRIGLEIERRLRRQHQHSHDDADRECGAEQRGRKLTAPQPDDRQREQHSGEQGRRQGGEGRDQRRVHRAASGDGPCSRR